MKTFALLVAAALIIGGIYHTEVSRYFAHLTARSSNSGGATSVMGSIRDMGNSGNSLMRGVGNALHR
jgi:hypothetical protein